MYPSNIWYIYIYVSCLRDKGRYLVCRVAWTTFARVYGVCVCAYVSGRRGSENIPLLLISDIRIGWPGRRSVATVFSGIYVCITNSTTNTCIPYLYIYIDKYTCYPWTLTFLIVQAFSIYHIFIMFPTCGRMSAKKKREREKKYKQVYNNTNSEFGWYLPPDRRRRNAFTCLYMSTCLI